MTHVLSVNGLSHKFGQKQVLDDVTFTLAKGTFCALVGPNGAGKTTLFSYLTGQRRAENGQVALLGLDLATSRRLALARMGVVFQEPTLDLDLSVMWNMRYFAGLHGLGGQEAQSRIDAALERLALTDRASETARTLNGGHRRRMEIARALISEPELLLLDEPTQGLDPASRRAITEHVHALAADGIAVLWATHLTDEIAPTDRSIVLHHGRIRADGQAQTIAGDAPFVDAFFDLTRDVSAP